MASALASLLPAPVYAQRPEVEAPIEKVQQLALKSSIPPYGQRKGWRPSKPEDFGDGGAYPECHIAQYPQEIGRKVTGGSTLALQVGADGKVQFDAIARQGHREGRNVQTSFKDLVPYALRDGTTEADLAMSRPSEEDVAATTEKTKAAFEKLVQGKIKAANPKHVPQGVQKETYIRYTAGTGQGVDGNSQRIIKMVDVVEDPLEPARFKAKKIPRGPPSPPAPVLRSPPRKVSAQEQKEWMIPPCVSNWKNNKGYTIPLDKRLAADGRGLQDVHINDRFATLSESLYVADRHAREEVRARAQMQQRIAQKEKESKEEALRQMAQEMHAAAHISGPSSRPRVAEGRPGNVTGGLAGYGSDTDSEAGASDAPTPPGPSRRGARIEDDDEPSPDRREDPEEKAARQRDEMRRERHKEREREMRMSNMGTEQRARVLARAQNRDISEKIALGLAKPTMSKDAMMDSRLFNKDQYGHSFGDDDSYNLYDRPLFQGSSAAAAIYKPLTADEDDEVMGDTEGVKRALNNDRFGLGVASKGFDGADLQGPREGPVQFERDTPSAAADGYGINAFLQEATRGAKRGPGLDTTGGREAKRAREDDDCFSPRTITAQHHLARAASSLPVLPEASETDSGVCPVAEALLRFRPMQFPGSQLMNGSGEAEDDHHAKGVGSLRSHFEALSSHASLHVPRKLSISHLSLPHRAHSVDKTSERIRAASTPPSPSDAARSEYFGDETRLGIPRSIRPSPSQPNLRLRGTSDGSRSGSTSLSASPPRTPDSDVITPRAMTVDKPVVLAEKPVVPPRPSAQASTSEKSGKGDPPPIPSRKKAATVSATSSSSSTAPPVPVRHHAPTISVPSDMSAPAPLPQRRLSPSPISSPAASPRSLVAADSVAGVRSTSPLQLDESADPRLPPTIPPRPASESMAGTLSSSPQPPPLPMRKATSALSASPAKPLVPPRVEALSSSLPSAVRRSSEPDVGTPTLAPKPSAMKKTLSDQSISSGILPPPARTVGHGDRPAAIKPPIAATASDSDEEEPLTPEKKAIDDIPDATYASRRAPDLRPPRAIHSKATLTSVTSHGLHIAACGLHHVRIYDSETSTQKFSIALPGEPKTTFVEFRGPRLHECERVEEGRHLWVGCKDGQLFGLDIEKGELVNSRADAHSFPIIGIFRRDIDMLTLDESGKLQVWLASQRGSESHLGETAPKTLRIEKAPFSALLGDKLWTASHMPRTGGIATANRAPLIRIYAPFAEDTASFTLLPRPAQPPDTHGAVGAVTAATTLQSSKNVFLGHETGHISIWSNETYECTEVLRISNVGITAMCGAGPLLWTGYRSGYICVYDVEPRPWKVVKAWKAHKDAVTTLFVDSSCLWIVAALHVISVGLDQVVHIWDGFLRSDWLAMHLAKRELDFCTYDSLKVLMCTWNLDAAKPQDLAADIAGSDLLPSILSQVDAPDVIVFGFQEMIDLQDKRLTAKSILFGRKRADSMLSDNVSAQYRLWHDKLVQAIRLAMPADNPYSVTHTENLVGLFTCVFVRNSQRLRLRDMDVSTVKTGMGGRYGNKGAIVSRFVIDDSSICFVNCHLAAGQSHQRQRNKDLIEILEAKAPFAETHPSSGRDAWILGGDGAMVFDHSIVFLSGDLNYRVDMRRETVISSIDAAKLAPLLAQDQLLKEKRGNPAFRLKSFHEAPITFAPTYKYDRGSDVYDTSEKARAPAWCDRVLYRVLDPAAVQPLHYRRHEVRISDHRPVSAGFLVRIRRVDHDKKRDVETDIATKWSAHEHSLIEKAKAFHFNSR